MCWFGGYPVLVSCPPCFVPGSRAVALVLGPSFVCAVLEFVMHAISVKIERENGHEIVRFNGWIFPLSLVEVVVLVNREINPAKAILIIRKVSGCGLAEAKYLNDAIMYAQDHHTSPKFIIDDMDIGRLRFQ